MVRRSTWILLIVFAVLVGFAYFFQRYQANQIDTAATSTPTSVPVSVYNLGETQVNDIKISDASGNTIDLYRDAFSAKWAIADMPEDKVDSAKIETISTQLFDLTAQETLTQTPPLDSIGLVTPAYTITMTASDGTQSVTNIGAQTPIGSGYYARVNNGQVMILDKVVMDDITKLLTDPPLLPTPTPEVTPTGTASPAGTETVATATP